MLNLAQNINLNLSDTVMHQKKSEFKKGIRRKLKKQDSEDEDLPETHNGDGHHMLIELGLLNDHIKNSSFNKKTMEVDCQFY